VIFIVGSRLAVLDFSERKKSQITYLGPKKIREIIFITLSQDSKYLAASVINHGNQATLLIFLIDNHSIPRISKPRHLQHAASRSFDGCSFSSNSELIAAFTNVQSEGILIYDRITEVLLRSVNIESYVSSVSFNPEDQSRICTTGTHLQFSRYTLKTVHNAPITGIQSSGSVYTCHAWLPDRRVVAGTDKGELIVIYQTNVQSTHLAFGSAEHYDYESEGKVSAILVDDRHVIAVSASNYTAVFEISPLLASTGVTSSTTSQRALTLKAKFRFGNGVNEIKGISLHKHMHPSLQSPVILLVISRTSICAFEMIAAGPTEGPTRGSEGTPVLARTLASTPGLAKTLARTVNLSPTKLMRQSSFTSKSPSNSVSIDLEWIDIIGKALYNFHGDQIDSLCVATRSSSFVTSSLLDKTIRVWDYTKPYDSSDMTEDYSDRGDNMPFKIAMHPSGWTIACATEVYTYIYIYMFYI
jgi:WD40 repeat protein